MFLLIFFEMPGGEGVPRVDVPTMCSTVHNSLNARLVFLRALSGLGQLGLA